MSESWTVDGVNLSNYASGVIVNDIRTWNGLDNIPGVNVSGGASGSGGSGTNGMYQLAQTHGEFWYPQYFTAATKLMTIFVSSNSSGGSAPTSVDQARQYFDANLDALSKLFFRRRNLMSVVRTLSSGSQRLALCSVMSTVEPTLIPVTSGMITVELTIPDSFWRDASDSTLVPTIAAGFSGTLSAMAAATAPMNDLQFTITGPITNPKIQDNESGNWVQYNGTVPASDTLVITNTTMGISGTGFTPSLINMVHAGDSNWLTLYPTTAGGVNISFTGTSTSGATNLAIYGHMKYLR